MTVPKSDRTKAVAAHRSPTTLLRDDLHAERPLRDRNAHRGNTRSSPQKPVTIYEDTGKRPSMHKKSKSSVSLKSLIGNDKAKIPKQIPPEPQNDVPLKRPKSSTGLSALLSRSRSPKKQTSDCKSAAKDKENRTPPQTADITPPPIWAQFASQPSQASRTMTTIPLNDKSDVERETALYTAPDYSPSKQRNFYDYRPTLARKSDKPRPRSEVIDSKKPHVFAAEKPSVDRVNFEQQGKPPVQAHALCTAGTKGGCEQGKRQIEGHHDRPQGSCSASTEPGRDVFSATVEKQQRGSRVMAAVAALNVPPQDVCKITADQGVQILDVKAIESEFETLLETRNIPHNVRDRMRSLNTNIKVDFIRKERFASNSISSTEGRVSAGSRDASRKRPNTGGSSIADRDAEKVEDEPGDKTEDEGSPKKRRSRPRSRTFTFSKGDSVQKKERSKSRGRSKSRTRVPEDADRPQTPEGRRSFSFSRTPKPALPEDFLSYMRKTQKPQDVEVGRLQKLRQLLRNETVGWVNAFIGHGGMTEIIALLHRILGVEWREEHEDTLLHETLLCLKAMCTTAVALQQLANIASTLFPTLLNMLFDEQRKGPSEFTTRSVVMSLLFIHLTAASPSTYEKRAKEIMEHLRDAAKPEDAQPPGFIASMHHSRPYRVWCKEMVNVTKEVFWIFIHHGNVIPYPQEDPAPSASSEDLDRRQDYHSLHFPPPHPPVPAAPYVGGVEWDATNYLANHLDLLNGLIASLDSREERNTFRQELKDSGFEKCMGGSLRTCKEKWYGYVHACLTTWVGAARTDGWDVRDVREGERRDERSMSPRKGKKGGEAPKLEMPQIDLKVRSGEDEGGWL
ncbi:MAG: hypothetical protein Q9185_002242 [Variospora sp. 1 TL-2023]